MWKDGASKGILKFPLQALPGQLFAERALFTVRRFVHTAAHTFMHQHYGHILRGSLKCVLRPMKSTGVFSLNSLGA